MQLLNFLTASRSPRAIAALAGVCVIAATFVLRVSSTTKGGHFQIAHDSPIFQDITRAAFLYQSREGQASIHFSTLERPHSRFLLVSYTLASGDMNSQTVEGSGN